jgi:hypothetical protein
MYEHAADPSFESRGGRESRDQPRLGQVPRSRGRTLAAGYTRTGDRTYRFESDGGAFQADLEVDDEGLIVRYGSVWTRVT